MIFGTLIKRYNRFLADIELDDGCIITAHCPNSGKLRGVLDHARVALTDHGEGGTRKLRYSWEWFLDNQTWVSINTHHANTFIEKCLQENLIPEFHGMIRYAREVSYGTRSRVDFLLHFDTYSLYLEVKSVHWSRNGRATFPDCPTERGSKHLGELSKVVNDGTRSCVLYLVQRHDCTEFTLAHDIDPVYAAASQRAKIVGVSFLSYACHFAPESGVTRAHKMVIVD
jgi:sugar fermentation stimulation protein A